MIYRLGRFSLDTDRAELSGPRGPVGLEPKAYDLLRLLVERQGRLVTREEAIAAVWGGRFISDAAISTVLKMLRKALDDDGKTQRVIRTIHGRGFRLVAEPPARPHQPEENSAVPDRQPVPWAARPSLAILPFRRLGASDILEMVADGLPADLISGISRLRWLRVLAQETTFRFRDTDHLPHSAAARLGATYALCGTVEVVGGGTLTSIELSDLRTGAVVWAEQLEGRLDDLYQTRAAISAAVLAALEIQIPLNEALRARSCPTEQLDAWGAYHLGLQHIFRFTEADNAIATGYLERATQLDQHFASAFAALSFTSYQMAAMQWTPDRNQAIRQTQAYAERSLELDPLDPFANLVEGRLFLLLNRPEDGQLWLDRSVQLSPSYAKGYYSRGFAAMLAGRVGDCLADMERAMALSPLDPMLCAMQTCKAIALHVAGRPDEAVIWANKGARAPHAHIAMLMTAVAVCQLAGDHAGARTWKAVLRTRYPDASLRRFFTVLPFTDAALRSLLGRALQEAGIPA
ncbi:winged helix-turn-helix domain-containing protein [Paracoccus sp. WLY502]|uniref:winged helix-turn-helix domain-containing protein n=1 Tax=Paracoccus yibinensis TaxID=3068891 RepID=UPI0027967F88|nr:winged helix-turn-helix domain-containing protein [Paracoccus sp. WLY502]MDQ1902912.1 winged helix-turn-helix domain-containing protein [Paracoccus sp. WLY502]